MLLFSLASFLDPLSPACPDPGASSRDIITLLRYPAPCPVRLCANRAVFENLHCLLSILSGAKTFAACFPSLIPSQNLC